MRISRTAGARLASALCVLGMTVLAGCGEDDGIGKRFKISGTVTYNGVKVPKGTVNFLPVDTGNGRAASGVIKDGSYSMTTQSPGDGVLGGKYKVVISAYDVDEASVKAQMKSQSGAMPQDLLAQAPKKALVPTKYASMESSGLEATVDASKTMDWLLTGDLK